MTATSMTARRSLSSLACGREDQDEHRREIGVGGTGGKNRAEVAVLERMSPPAAASTSDRVMNRAETHLYTAYRRRWLVRAA